MKRINTKHALQKYLQLISRTYQQTQFHSEILTSETKIDQSRQSRKIKNKYITNTIQEYHVRNIDQYHQLLDQNVKLRTKIHNLQKQIGELRQVVYETNFENKYQKELGNDKNDNLQKRVIKMKQIIKEQKQNHQKTNQQLETLKKSVKAVKMNELQSELEKYTQQAMRLRSIITMQKSQNKQNIEMQKQNLKKIIREGDRHNKQLVRDNQDYKYRLKSSLNLIEKILLEPKSQVKAQHLRRVKVMLNINAEKNKENQLVRAKRIGGKQQKKEEINKPLDKIRINFKPIQRIQFSLAIINSQIKNQQEIEQSNPKLMVPYSISKRSIQIIQQKSTQDFRTLTIDYQKGQTDNQDIQNYYQDQFTSQSSQKGQEQKNHMTIDQFYREEFDRTTNSNGQASIDMIS